MIYIVQKRYPATPDQEFHGSFSSLAEAVEWAQKELGETRYIIRSVQEPWKEEICEE